MGSSLKVHGELGLVGLKKILAQLGGARQGLRRLSRYSYRFKINVPKFVYPPLPDSFVVSEIAHVECYQRGNRCITATEEDQRRPNEIVVKSTYCCNHASEHSSKSTHEQSQREIEKVVEVASKPSSVIFPGKN